jgi:hypothetical protein
MILSNVQNKKKINGNQSSSVCTLSNLGIFLKKEENLIRQDTFEYLNIGISMGINLL